MSKSKKRLDHPGQLNIFDLISDLSEKQRNLSACNEPPGGLNIDAAVREMVSDGLKKTTLSRYQVAAAMSRLLGREITKSQIDSWSAESKQSHRLSVVYLPAFIEATGDKEILRLICDKAGGYFIEGDDALKLELGKIQEEKKDLQKKERTIREFLDRKVRRKAQS